MNTEIYKNIKKIIDKAKALAIILHNYPDPDAIASGWALKYLAEEKFGIQADIIYGGLIGRAENMAMVRELKIPMLPVKKIKSSGYDCVAMVDTQPGQGNHSLPENTFCNIVIDHHAKGRNLKAEFAWIDTSYGASAVMLYELLKKFDLDIPVGLATALVYAIRSETQDLGREAAPKDIRAFFDLFPRANVKVLSRIVLPTLPRSYFITLSKALKYACTYRHLMIANMGRVPYPEIVAEFADFLLRHERITWTLCTGIHHKKMILSLRTTHVSGKAGKLLKKLIKDPKNAGGHDTFAGGIIHLKDEKEDTVILLQDEIAARFAASQGYEEAEWKPILNNGALEQNLP